MTQPTTDPTPQPSAPHGETAGQQQTGTPQGTPDGQQPAPGWEDLFDGENPADVREKLEHARKWETRAKENFEAAQKWRELEDSKKTPDQKTSEALTAAEHRAQEAEARLVRFEVLAETGMKPEDAKWLQGSTKEELLASAEEFLTRVGIAAEQRRGPAPDPTQGRGGNPVPADPALAFQRSLQESLNQR